MSDFPPKNQHCGTERLFLIRVVSYSGDFNSGLSDAALIPNQRCIQQRRFRISAVSDNVDLKLLLDRVGVRFVLANMPFIHALCSLKGTEQEILGPLSIQLLLYIPPSIPPPIAPYTICTSHYHSLYFSPYPPLCSSFYPYLYPTLYPSSTLSFISFYPTVHL